MASPESNHKLVSPGTAVAACAVMAIAYVAVLYAPSLLQLPPPTSPRSFFLRRFACVTFSSSASFLAAASLLQVWRLGDVASMLRVFGIRSDHLWEAVVIPVVLSSLVYWGSLVDMISLLVSSWSGGDVDGDKIGRNCREKIGSWIWDKWHDILAWRTYVVAPLTEELVFRACMIPLLLCGGHKTSSIVFLSPIFFSLAHFHHFVELHYLQRCNLLKAFQIVGLQLGYTVIFGWYTAFLFIRTGNILSPLMAHIFCNIMGLPFPRRMRGVEGLALVAGTAAFFWLLFPATSPKMYNDSVDRCSCWHGYCKWS